MEKPDLSKRNLEDWDHPVTNEWIEYAQTAQTSHCCNISANEAGSKYSEELFSKIDDLVLMHAFGAVKFLSSINLSNSSVFSPRKKMQSIRFSK